MGTAFAMPLSGLLCENGFRSPPHQSKWPSVFYVFGQNVCKFCIIFVIFFKAVLAWFGVLPGLLSFTTRLNLIHELASKNEIILYQLSKRNIVCQRMYVRNKNTCTVHD